MNMELITAVESLVAGALGGLGTVYGLSKWLGSLWLERQKSQYAKELEGVKTQYATELEIFRDDLQQKQKRIQAVIDKSIFVTRAHFETEFAAMKELFSCLADVQLTMNTLRPSVDIKPSKKEEQMRQLSQQYENFSTAYNQLLKHSEALSPFYPLDLYAAVDECLSAANMELMQVKAGGDSTFTLEWYREGSENRKNFSTGYQKVSKIIRERVATLTVISAN